jgi:vacuolar-type H+-ATPase subunit I/STV1
MTIHLADMILVGLVALNIGILWKTWNSSQRVTQLEDVIEAFLDGVFGEHK